MPELHEPPRRIPRAIGVVVVAVVGWLIAGPVGMIVATVVVVAAPIMRRRRQRTRARRRSDAGIATIFEIAARAVRAGGAPRDALREAVTVASGPSGDIVRAVLEGSRHPGTAPCRLPVADATTLDVVGAVLAMTMGTRGGGARALEAGAVLLREHDRTAAEIIAGASHARASARLLIAVPLTFAAASLWLSPDALRGLETEPMVLASVLVGLGLEAVGAVWMSRQVHACLRGAP